MYQYKQNLTLIPLISILLSLFSELVTALLFFVVILYYCYYHTSRDCFIQGLLLQVTYGSPSAVSHYTIKNSWSSHLSMHWSTTGPFCMTRNKRLLLFVVYSYRQCVLLRHWPEALVQLGPFAMSVMCHPIRQLVIFQLIFQYEQKKECWCWFF